MYKSATNVPKFTREMHNVLNTDPILSVPNVTGVPNVKTVPNVPKVTKNDTNVPVCN